MVDRTHNPTLSPLESKILWVSLFIVCMVSILPMKYVTLQADEYCRSVRIAEQSILGCVYEDYFQMTGRWFAFTLEYLLISGHRWSLAYPLTLIGIALTYGLALKFLIGTLFPKIETPRQYLIAGILLGLYWVGLPSTRDAFYCIFASVEYQLTIAMSLFAIGLTISAASKYTANEKCLVPFVLAMLFAAVTPGLHELYGLMLCIVLLFGSAYVLFTKSSSRAVWVGVTCAGLAGFAVSYLAPGNGVRMAGQEHAAEPLAAIKVALLAMLQTLPDWVFDARLILASLLVIAFIPNQLSQKVPWLGVVRSRWIALFPLAWFVLILGAFLGPAWGTGSVVASRTWAPSYMIFLLGWFINGLLLLAWLQSKSIQLFRPQPLMIRGLVLFFAVSLLLTGNTRRAVRELSGPLQRYAEEKQQRHELLATAGRENEPVVVVPRLETASELIGFSDLTNEPGNWINRCTAKYYGVGEIQLEASKSQHE